MKHLLRSLYCFERFIHCIHWRRGECAEEKEGDNSKDEQPDYGQHKRQDAHHRILGKPDVQGWAEQENQHNCSCEENGYQT